MNLKVILPAGIYLDREAVKVVAASPAGEFCLLPRHIDYFTALAPGILSYVIPAGTEHFLAVDGGILAKQGPAVLVATRRAVAGALGELQQEVEKMLSREEDRQKNTRSAVARLEAGFLRRFMEFGKHV